MTAAAAGAESDAEPVCAPVLPPVPDLDARAGGLAAGPGNGRDVRLDALRGVAVLLMVVDHAASAAPLLFPALVPAAAHGWLWWLRRTLTRFSMPLFMLVSGALLARAAPSPRRRAQVAALAVAVQVLLAGWWPQFARPEILVVWSLVMTAAEVLRRFPFEMVVLGVLQQVCLPVGWYGYQPGLVTAFVALGVLWAQLPQQTVFDRAVSLPRWVAATGRRPLLVYATHLLALAAFVHFS